MPGVNILRKSDKKNNHIPKKGFIMNKLLIMWLILFSQVFPFEDNATYFRCEFVSTFAKNEF